MNGQSDSTIAALLRHFGTALVQRYVLLSPTHLRAAGESVASYGKPSVAEGGKSEEPRARSTNPSTGTVTTGMEEEKEVA